MDRPAWTIHNNTKGNKLATGYNCQFVFTRECEESLISSLMNFLEVEILSGERYEEGDMIIYNINLSEQKRRALTLAFNQVVLKMDPNNLN